MKKMVLFALLPVVVGAADFPYVAETSMTARFTGEGITVNGTSELSKVDDGMPSTDSVVSSTFTDVQVEAIWEESWASMVSDLGTPQFALTMMEKTDGSFVWKGYVGGEWVELTGDAAEGKWTYRIDIDQTLGADQNKVRYAVKQGEGDFVVLKKGDAEWLAMGNSQPASVTAVKMRGAGTVAAAVLKSGQRQSEATVAAVENCSMDNTKLTLELDIADVWGANTLTVELKQGDDVKKTVDVTPLAAGKRNVLLDGLSAGNYTYQIKLSGTYKGANLASAKDAVTVTLETPKMTLEGNTIVLSSNAEVDLADTAAGSYAVSSVAGKKCHLKWTDANGKYAVMSEGTLEVMEGRPENGLDSFMSYVLGLDATDSTAKPYVASASVQTDNPNEFTFTLPNINPKSESETGVAVSYDLIASTEPSFPDGKKAVVDSATENRLSYVQPSDSDKVTYYKIEINMK